MVLENIRSYLSTNKIFFETIAATLLSAMAIIVSFQSYRVSERQLFFMEAQTLPNIRFQERLIYNSEKEYYEDDILYVYNDGAFLTNFDINVYTIAHIEIMDDSFQEHEYEFAIQYYGTRINTQNSEGLLATVKGYKNNSSMAKLEKNFRQLCSSGPEFMSCFISHYSIAKVNYIDSTRRAHTYYFMTHNGGVPANTEYAERKIEDNFNGKIPNSVSDMSLLEIIDHGSLPSNVLEILKSRISDRI